jgi:hypothetical protein
MNLLGLSPAMMRRRMMLAMRAATVLEATFITRNADDRDFFGRSYFGRLLRNFMMSTFSAPLGIEAATLEAELTFLLQHIQEVKDHDREMFREYRRRVGEASCLEQLYEARAEISAAATLVRAGVRFRRLLARDVLAAMSAADRKRARGMPEMPDFELALDGEKFFVESTSAFLQGDRVEQASNKGAFAIRRKAKKSYATQGTCLFVDVTQPVNLLLSAEGQNPNTVRDQAALALADAPFAAAVLFAFTISFGDTWTIQSNYWRLDSDRLKPPMRAFLDRHFPFSTPSTSATSATST